MTMGTSMRVSKTSRFITQYGLGSEDRLNPPGSVLLTSRAPIGEVVINEVPMATNQGFIGIQCGEKLYNIFLFYWLKANKEYLISSANGTTFLELPKYVFKKLEINLPPIKEQIAIATILETLDKKIELNQKTNEILEEMAQAIFKSWIVDFEPFQDGEFEDSELGEIPKGWRVEQLGNFVHINMGQSPPGSTYNEEGKGMPFFQGIKDFGSRFPSIRIYTTGPKKIAEPNDVLISVRAPIGSLNIAKEKCCIGRGLASLRMKENHCSFLYYLLKSISHIWGTYEGQGTVFSNLRLSDLQALKVIKPKSNIIKEFDSITHPLDLKYQNNINEINTLTELRDVLLPHLISGKIRISDPENFLAEVKSEVH